MVRPRVRDASADWVTRGAKSQPFGTGRDHGRENQKTLNAEFAEAARRSLENPVRLEFVRIFGFGMVRRG